MPLSSSSILLVCRKPIKQSINQAIRSFIQQTMAMLVAKEQNYGYMRKRNLSLLSVNVSEQRCHTFGETSPLFTPSKQHWKDPSAPSFGACSSLWCRSSCHDHRFPNDAHSRHIPSIGPTIRPHSCPHSLHHHRQFSTTVRRRRIVSRCPKSTGPEF